MDSLCFVDLPAMMSTWINQLLNFIYINNALISESVTQIFNLSVSNTTNEYSQLGQTFRLSVRNKLTQIRDILSVSNPNKKRQRYSVCELH